jgi:N-acetylglucosaminyl-diphospho-decaprenol L-rhamnosyltransferase
MLDLAIIIVNHNHGAQAQRAVESLYALPDEAKFRSIVVDNASTDGVADWLTARFAQTCLIRNTCPQGFAHNNNLGLQRKGEARYVILMNPDIQCLPGVLDELVDYMDSNPDVGIAGPKLLNEDGTVQMSCRRFSTPLSVFIRGLHLDRVLQDTTVISDYLLLGFDHRSTLDVDWVTGAFQIVRPVAIEQIGLLDERYLLYSEDQDWCCQMWRGGWRVCYVPQAQAIHSHMREGMRNLWSKAGRHQIVSALKMFRKFGWHLSRTE